MPSSGILAIGRRVQSLGFGTIIIGFLGAHPLRLSAQTEFVPTDSAPTHIAKPATASPASVSPTVTSPWSVGVWFTAGTNQVLHTRLGHTHTRDLYIAGIRIERPIRRWPGATLYYTADIVPFFVTTQMPEYTRYQIFTPAGHQPYVRLYPSYHTAHGGGLVPLGARAELGAPHMLRLVAAMSGGGMYFDRYIPDPEGSRFNFTADALLGVMLRTRVGALTVGGRFHHLSNAKLGRVNPGMNSRMLSVSLDR